MRACCWAVIPPGKCLTFGGRCARREDDVLDRDRLLVGVRGQQPLDDQPATLEPRVGVLQVGREVRRRLPAVAEGQELAALARTLAVRGVGAGRQVLVERRSR